MLHKYVGGWLLGLFFSTSALAADLRLVSTTWPPFSDLNLPYNGLAVDLVSTALERAGYHSDYFEVPWARAINGLQHDHYDIVITAWYAAEREAFGQFSEPYLSNRIRFLRQTGSRIDYQQLSDLRPYLIAVGRGYTYAPAFDTDHSLHKQEVTDFPLAARMLAAGRVQLTLEDELVAQYLLNRELLDVRDRVEFLAKPLAETPLHILVRRSHPQHQQIIDGFNKAIRAMRADGSYARIIQRHTRQPASPPAP